MNWTPKQTEFYGGVILITACLIVFIAVNFYNTDSVTINRIIGAISGFCVTSIVGVLMVIRSNNKKHE